MTNYCLDTSGVSKPWLELPVRVFPTLWLKVWDRIENDCFCWNDEIAQEIDRLDDPLRKKLKSREHVCRFRNDSTLWPYGNYSNLILEWERKYSQYIQENHGNRTGTIGRADLSIVALAKTLTLPIVSMERPNTSSPSKTKIRIPELCKRENITHLNFVEFLEAEGVVV